MSARVGVTYSNEIKLQPYLDALRAAGVEPVPLAAGANADAHDLDGLLLSGGLDLNPHLYGQEMHAEADEPNDARDRLELDLLRDALDRDLPVLAICRGMQLFNVAHGGSLDQHMAAHALHQQRPADKSTPAHEIEIAPESKLADILETSHASVNSRHHQAVDRVGAGLVVSARAQDGAVEALEVPARRFAIAVQWHPEDQAPRDAVQRRLFEKFAEAVRRS